MIIITIVLTSIFLFLVFNFARTIDTKASPTLAVDGPWSSASWSNGNTRELQFGDRDPDDENVELTGIGNAWISGTGTMALSGDAPRFRVVEKDYRNVNVTLYAMRVDEDRELSYQGFVIGARSKHYTDDECYANTYYSRLTYDGRISFEKELFHGEDGGTVQYPSPQNTVQYYEEGVPFDEWIGLKFLVTTVDNGSSALLQLYLDPPGEGIRWHKVLENKDDGNWETDVEDDPCDGYPQNKILLSPGFVFIRNDGLGEAKYKEFSIKEMTPEEVRAADLEGKEVT